MRILDIDLDFFLSDIALDRSSNGERLSEADYQPWCGVDVIDFLENQLGLSKRAPIPGKYITHHDEAFMWWKSLILAKRLATPFEVVHVDAHADLGAGSIPYSAAYVCFDLLHQPVGRRQHPKTGALGMNAGNYLLIALACRWVSKLVYVSHSSNPHLTDCEHWLFSEKKGRSWKIALPKLQKPPKYITAPGKILGREPTVDFEIETRNTIQESGEFDFMVLCQSPGFTPASSDKLVPIIQAYMNLNA